MQQPLIMHRINGGCSISLNVYLHLMLSNGGQIRLRKPDTAYILALCAVHFENVHGKRLFRNIDFAVNIH